MNNTYKFKTTINCGGCLASVKPTLDANPSIEKWDVDISHPDKILTVILRGDEPNTVITDVRKVGFSIDSIEL